MWTMPAVLAVALLLCLPASRADAEIRILAVSVNDRGEQVFHLLDNPRLVPKFRDGRGNARYVKGPTLEYQIDVPRCPDGSVIRADGLSGAYGTNHELKKNEVPCKLPLTVFEVEKSRNPLSIRF